MNRGVKSRAWTLYGSIQKTCTHSSSVLFATWSKAHYLTHHLLVLRSGLCTSLWGFFWRRGPPNIHKSRRVFEIKYWRNLSTWWSRATEHSKNPALCSRLHDSTRPRLWGWVVEINLILPLNFQYWTRDPYTIFRLGPPNRDECWLIDEMMLSDMSAERLSADRIVPGLLLNRVVFLLSTRRA
jgi:hypothetical protein